MQQAPTAVTAIASRDLPRRRRPPEAGIPKAYGSYEELLADPEIDAVYNPLPNHLHVPWSIKALEAGKHVLCEKPIALTRRRGADAGRRRRPHPQLKVMEAFMYRLHPQWQRAKQIVTRGGIGELRTIQSFFSYYNDDPANIRNQADIGGGGLMDIGCYNISLSRFIFGAEPQRVVRHGRVRPAASRPTGWPRACWISAAARPRSPARRSWRLPARQYLWHHRPDRDRDSVQRAGRPALPDLARSTTATSTRSSSSLRSVHAPGRAWLAAIMDDTPVPTPIEDAVANMRVIEAIVRSGREGTWVAVG